MSRLKAFLKPLAEGTVKYAASHRFVDEDGKPMEWEIRVLTAAEDEMLRQACTKPAQVPGWTGPSVPELNLRAYASKLAAACTVYPDLRDRELQDFYHVMGEENLLKAMLGAGEYNLYANKVQEVNGLKIRTEDLVEEAKN